MYKLIALCVCFFFWGTTGVATAQPTYWNLLHDFCIDTPYASNNIAQYVEDSFFIAAGQTYTPGVSGNHAYIATIDYNGDVQHSRNLYFPGPYNAIITPPPHAGTSYPLTKFGNDKYLLVGNELDYTINSKTIVYQPFLFFLTVNAIACII